MRYFKVVATHRGNEEWMLKEFNNGRFFPSMAETFKVSNEAMAIRLEELELVVF